MTTEQECFTKLFDGCTCEPGQCQSFDAEQKRKGRDLGTFKKERPAPVVGPTRTDTAVIAALIAVMALVGGMTIKAAHDDQRAYQQARV